MVLIYWAWFFISRYILSGDVVELGRKRTALGEICESGEVDVENSNVKNRRPCERRPKLLEIDSTPCVISFVTLLVARGDF